MRDAAGARTLDFLVIGVQKGGTTSLWQYLRSHPRIRLPRDKEAPIFASPDADDPDALWRFVAADFGDAPDDAVLGAVTPHYMMGNTGASAEQIAARIAAALPQVRIVALLRDPIERAISHHRMSVRRGWEARTFEDAAADLLDPARAQEARTSATETNSYLAQGEYGRILQGYRRHIPAERTLVATTEALERDPGRVVDDVLTLLGLPPGHRPPDLGSRYHEGGSRPRVDAPAERELLRFLGEEIFPALPEGHPGPRAFDFFLTTWNVAPDGDTGPAPLSPELRIRLEEHYAADAQLLEKLGIAAPWLEAWRTRSASSPAPAPARRTDGERDLRRAVTEAHDRLLRREEELAHTQAQLRRAQAAEQRLHGETVALRAELDAERAALLAARGELEATRQRLAASEHEALRLRTRLDRILRLPPMRLYARVQRLPGVRALAGRRLAAFDTEVAQRAAGRR